jgi:hypothetical protein
VSAYGIQEALKARLELRSSRFPGRGEEVAEKGVSSPQRKKRQARALVLPLGIRKQPIEDLESRSIAAHDEK